MQKSFIIVSIVCLLALGAGFTARAHEEDTINEVHLSELHTVLGIPVPTLLPDSPWYFMKNIGRGIRLFLTFDPAKKAELELQFTDEKLAEMGRVLVKDPDQKGLERALQNYLDSQKRLRDRLESLAGKNKNVDRLLEKLDGRVKKHQELFEGLKSRVGEQAAENAKKELMEINSKGKELMEEKTKGMSPKEDKMMRGTEPEKTMDNSMMKESPINVAIEGFSFKEKEFRIPVGTTVRWTNKDSVRHDVASDAGKFGSKLLSKDETFEYAFAEKGVFPYHCNPHPNMKGKIIVE